MDRKNFIRIVNEEINNFDFLNNEKSLKEQESIDLLMNEDLQKQFICDSLLNRKDKIKIIKVYDSSLGGNWEEPDFEDANKLTVEYNINIEYKYDVTKEPIKFDLGFYGDNIEITIGGIQDGGDFNTPQSTDSWFKYVGWDNINVTMFGDDENEIEFLAFRRAPLNIQKLFVREFVGEFIMNHTSMNIQDKPNGGIVTQYC